MTLATASATFTERHVEADGFEVQYLEAGSGPPLVHIHSAAGLHITPAHELLSNTFRVIAFEVPGYARSAPNERSTSLAELGTTLVKAAHQLGINRFNLWGSSFGGALALWAAIGAPQSIDALILEAPGAIPPENGYPPVGGAEELHQYLYAHPERHAPAVPPDPDTLAQRRALLQRLGMPPREETEQRLGELQVPTLVVFGTHDRLTPPDLGRIYREKMPNCQFVLVYDAAHEIATERPEAFSSLVSDYIERHEAFIVSRTSSLLHP